MSGWTLVVTFCALTRIDQSPGGCWGAYSDPEYANEELCLQQAPGRIPFVYDTMVATRFDGEAGDVQMIGYKCFSPEEMGVVADV
ncbi:MAG: hypothetical protein AAGK37_19240 [Pseudomonadota bacterium]